MANRLNNEVIKVEEAEIPVATIHSGSKGASSAELASTLRELLAGRTGERHIVAIQDFPDPDAKIGRAHV